jgi:zinc and cadmium transporter
MPAPAWVAIYSLAVLLFSLAGGGVPLLGRVTHGRLQLYLSLSAGVMLGAAFFHVMPDAFESAGDAFGWWMAAGVVGLFCIERFLAPHTHETNGKSHHHDHEHFQKGEHVHEHQHGVVTGAALTGVTAEKHEHAHEHPHNHGHDHSPVLDHKPAAPAVAGWAAVLGLTLHTFMNGVGLAGAVAFDLDPAHPSLPQILPGLALFLAIVLHKPADALAISTVLRRKGVSGRVIGLVQLGFALMVPIGAAAFLVAHVSVSQGVEKQITGAALAFSAGTFIFIALSDLLPEVQFHRHDRVPLFLALLAGIALMGGIAVLEDLGKHKDSEGDKKEEEKSSLALPSRHVGVKE